jgi:hypothetical protein
VSNLFSSGVRPAIDQWLLDEAAKKRDYGDYWSASSAGYCQRKVIFERLGVPHVKEDARKQRVFTSGHLFHDWIQGITKQAGLSIAQELELQDEELMIRGHIDDLVLVVDEVQIPEHTCVPYAHQKCGQHFDCQGPDDPRKGKNAQHLILYDYKTQNSRAFSYKRPNMSHYHRYQLGSYMYMLRKLAKQELERRK